MMEERDYYEAFGLDVPEDIEESSTETVDESSSEELGADDAHENAAESADEGEGEDDKADRSGEDDGTGEAHDDGKSSQDKRTRSGFAAARRRAEAEAKTRTDEAVKSARAAAIAETLKAIGAKNPYTGKIIENEDDLEAYRTAQSERVKQQFMRSAGQTTDEQYKQTISALPELKAAQDALTKERERAEAAEARIREADEEQFRASLEDEIKRIAATGEAVKTLADVAKLEKYPEMREKIRRGYTLEDAYMTVYRDEIESRRQATRNERAALAAASKSHMRRTRVEGDSSLATVPSEVIAEYRSLIPGMSDAEIAKHYNNYRKKR